MNAAPTYLFCVGATKAGTSWLYDHLAAHPACAFRTIKELHYFSMTEPQHFDTALRKGQDEIATLKDQRAALSDAARDWADRRLQDLRDWQKVLRLRKIDLPAYREFLTANHAGAQLVGDITPAYALMPTDRLKSLLHLGADVRIIYLMRDPLARLWSHVRMVVQRNAPQQFATEAQALLTRMLAGDLSGEGKGIAARGDYAAILPKLARAFDPTRLLVLFYEDMLTLPGVARLAAFLGLAPANADFSRRVHAGVALSMPDGLRAPALAYLRPQYDYVASQYPQLPAAWRVNLDKGLL